MAASKVMRLKSELRNLEPSDIGLPEGIRLFINKSLCPYHKALRNKRKKLWNKNFVFSFFTVTGCAGVKLQQQGTYQTITHIDDLK